jgi:hypothetical protein
MKLLALAAHVPSYPDPLRAFAGETLQPGRRDPDNPAWIWCTDPRGRAGWTPEALLDDGGRCVRDYDARELAVAPGDELARIEECAGWTLCARADGARGWVPSSCLRAAPG